MMDGILIPIKRLSLAKARLAHVVPSAIRRRLGLAMLADVLRSTDKWNPRLLVTDDPDAEAVGMAFGCVLVADPGTGLNPSVEAGTEAAISLGVTSLLVLASDLPLVTTREVASLFECEAEVAVAGSSDGGTNALLRRPPRVINPAFGPSSARLHETSARQQGRSFELIRSPGLQFDIDEPDDLAQLATARQDVESVKVAREAIKSQADGGREPL